MKSAFTLKKTPDETDYLGEALRSVVYDVAKVSDLDEMTLLSERMGNRIWAKREDQQLVHSFKLRGAYSMIAGLNREERQKGVVTASAGNHAQGVAVSGQKHGITPLIVMPKATASIKVNAVKAFGGKVLLFGENFDAAKAEALRLAEAHGMVFVPPFDHPAVIAGQATVGLELLRQQPKLDRIFVPVGGGGLAAGIAVVVKQVMPWVKIIGVESENSACLKKALKAGEPISLEKVGTFAEGVAVRQIGEETFRLCQKYLDDVVTVSNDAICAAMKDLFDDLRAVAEPAGALSLAGLKKYVREQKIEGENLAHILSGANVNFHALRHVSERCEIGEAREALFAVAMPEEKGSFLRFSKAIAGRMVTAFSYRLSDEKKAFIFAGIALSGTGSREEALSERQQILKDLKQAGFTAQDLSDDELGKRHIRHMIGGRPQKKLKEHLYRFEFPESEGALLKFLQTFSEHWQITLFHYQRDGGDFGQILAGFEKNDRENEEENFEKHLKSLGYLFRNEGENRAFKFFLSPFSDEALAEF